MAKYFIKRKFLRAEEPDHDHLIVMVHMDSGEVFEQTIMIPHTLKDGSPVDLAAAVQRYCDEYEAGFLAAKEEAAQIAKEHEDHLAWMSENNILIDDPAQ